MEPRGRGRARGGRARGEPAHQQASRPGPAQGQQRGPQFGAGGGLPPPQGAWGRPQGQPPRPGQPQQRPQAQPQQQPPQAPQGAWGRQPSASQPSQPQPVPAPQFTGRGSRVGGGEDGAAARPAPDIVSAVSGGGDPGGNRETTRGGGVRGRTNRNEVIHTKPADLRSKQGTTGQVVELTANYFSLINKPDWRLQQYRVDFNPEVDDTRMRKKLMHTAIREMKETTCGYLFDGTVLFTPSRLPDPLEKYAALEQGGQSYRITIKWVSELAWGDFHYLQVFNILIRRCLQLMELQLVGRDYYDNNAEIRITDHNLILWPGYLTSIRQHEAEILMNAELSFKVMRTDNVYDLLLTCTDRGGRNDPNMFMRKVIGSVVLTYYNNKTYRIDDVDMRTTPASTFKTKSGEDITYVEYYKRRYNLNIHVPTQPMLVSRSKPREIRAGMSELVYLVPELCQLTGLSDEQRSNFHLMSALAQHTRIGPGRRQERLLEFIHKINSKPETIAEIRKWDLKVADQLIRFKGRRLPQESIKFGDNAHLLSGNKADWTHGFRSNSLFMPEKMERMAVITPNSLYGHTEEFMKSLCKAGNGMRFNLSNYKIFGINNDRSAGYLDMLEDVISRSSPTLIMCVLQSKTADRYNAIKKKCCVDKGIPTQVVVSKNLRSKGVMSIATKIAIQMNCKIGGAPWIVSIPMKGLMVVGYDVCRDTANKGKSFGAMVASLNDTCSRYYSSVSEHQYEEELSNNWASFMLLACQKYKDVNGRYPLKICIFRDGVGDGQITYVMEHEVGNIKRRLEAEIYTTEKSLKMAVIIVSKRINTRIFERDNNPAPGTVVDNTITLPERYDYFIVSQCVNQGTVSPTSYHVVHDTMGLTPDHVQQLTYKMCHMYYNWSGTVRVPAPCQYAHKLAFLTAQSLHRSANRRLENVLFFL